ncbi:alpha/beta fold hydrolase [Kribbella catacumbae]|uniref:alpha/beta fold hydrolase n=1 Tax=Kribbella catacumbae TaxID=460086 RepID=UPI0003775902|nr:alpha/beta fold hydrolase [Kribbella catacumbae]
MSVKTAGRAAVPGATLYYELSGSGPILLLIAGGDADAGVFDGIAPQLAAQYTVVAYDPRGNSRSPYDGDPVDERVDLAAEDALAVLNAVAGRAPAHDDEPAYVFGTNSGAITAMELLIRHPDRIRRLIAHEPPAIELLPDATEARAFFRSVHDVYQREGRTAADRLLLDAQTPDLREVSEPNGDVFYAHKLLPFSSYVPDVAALVALEDKFVPAVGSESSKILPSDPILALADRVGWNVIAFPGGQRGYRTDPYEFATLLRRVLTGDLR